MTSTMGKAASETVDAGAGSVNGSLSNGCAGGAAGAPVASAKPTKGPGTKPIPNWLAAGMALREPAP